MFNEETIKKFEGFGFDVSKLIEVAKSDKEASLDVPNLKTEEEVSKLKTEDQFNTFGSNRFGQGKEAMEEIRAKEINDKNELGLEEKDRKNLDMVIDAFAAKKLKESGAKPDEWAQEKLTLQKNFLTEKEGRAADNTVFTQKLAIFKLRGEVSGLVDSTKKTKIDKGDILDIFFLKHRSQIVDGRTVWFQGDKKLQDDSLEPLTTKDVFGSFMDERKYYISSGMGGGDGNENGSADDKFTKFVDFVKYCEKNDLDPNSEEAQKILIDKTDPKVAASEAFMNDT